MLDLNPWSSIWTRPRATIAAIVAENPNRSLWWLAAIYGFSSFLNTSQSLMLGYNISLAAIFLLAVILGPLWGYVSFAVWSWVVSVTGRWLKGAGNYQTVRAAYAWSCVPLIANIPLWFVLASIFGQELFTNFSDNHILTQGQVTVLFCILIVRITVAIWSIVIYLNALAEVQKFSILRTIGNVLLSGLIVTVFAYALMVLFFTAYGQMQTP